MSIEQKLHKERSAIYGPHEENAEDFATIKAIFDRIGAYDKKDEFYIINLIQKFVRIANSPYYQDSHDDLRAYDMLWCRRMKTDNKIK